MWLTTAIGPIQRPDRTSGATNPTDLADRVPDLGESTRGLGSRVGLRLARDSGVGASVVAAKPSRRLISVTAAAKKILEDALALTDDERMELMAALSDSFEPEPTQLSPEWKAEIEGRIGQLERGEVEPVEWEQVEAKIRATLARR